MSDAMATIWRAHNEEWACGGFVVIYGDPQEIFTINYRVIQEDSNGGIYDISNVIDVY